jgi:spoIIIJ-associated protein
MIKVEALTLQEAYSQASEQLSCSITELTFEVIQHPRKGFMGMFKKNAIIVATCKKIENNETEIAQPKENEDKKKEEVKQPKIETKQETEKEIKQEIKKEIQQVKKHFKKEKEKEEEKIEETPKTPQIKIKEEQKDIFNNFYSENQTTTDVIYEIRADLEELFKDSCFDIEVTNVEFYDDKTVLIEFDGNDSALMIGKEGYRYKALSYMLFNWINSKYQLMIRLEIAQFLKNQEEMIDNYLAPIIEKIRKDGNAKTKPLDGVLIHIALTKLRCEFPNKYVGVKNSQNDNSKYIIINNFLSSNDKH